MSKYDFNEFGNGDQEQDTPRIDIVAVVAGIMVVVGIALVITIS